MLVLLFGSRRECVTAYSSPPAQMGIVPLKRYENTHQSKPYPGISFLYMFSGVRRNNAFFHRHNLTPFIKAVQRPWLPGNPGKTYLPDLRLALTSLKIGKYSRRLFRAGMTVI